MKKAILILFLAICVLFTLSSVCASDVNDIAIASDNTNQVIEETGIDDNLAISEDEATAQTDNEIISEKDDGTFTALQNKINNAPEGSTITLENDYVYDEGFDTNGIKINKDLTINGNGHTINAKENSRIFNCNNNKIILNNINFYNGHWESSSKYDANCKGGAIYSEAELQINNCNFINNQAYLANTYGYFGEGGAIYSTNNLILSNCKFERNHADNTWYYGLGGAIRCEGITKITNCIFNDNSAGYGRNPFADGEKWGDGGAIYNTGNLEIHNSKFTKNAGSEGSAIYNSGTLKVYDSTFSDTQSRSIYTSKGGVTKLSNCKFDSPKKLTPKLIAKKKTFKVKTKVKKYTATLKTNKNKAMKKVKLYLKVKGKTITAKTNSKGKATFKIKNLKKKGTFKAKITFKGNKNYRKVTKTVKIKVKK